MAALKPQNTIMAPILRFAIGNQCAHFTWFSTALRHKAETRFWNEPMCAYFTWLFTASRHKAETSCTCCSRLSTEPGIVASRTKDAFSVANALRAQVLLKKSYRSKVDGSTSASYRFQKSRLTCQQPPLRHGEKATQATRTRHPEASLCLDLGASISTW